METVRDGVIREDDENGEGWVDEADERLRRFAAAGDPIGWKAEQEAKYHRMVMEDRRRAGIRDELVDWSAAKAEADLEAKARATLTVSAVAAAPQRLCQHGVEVGWCAGCMREEWLSDAACTEALREVLCHPGAAQDWVGPFREQPALGPMHPPPGGWPDVTPVSGLMRVSDAGHSVAVTRPDGVWPSDRHEPPTCIGTVKVDTDRPVSFEGTFTMNGDPAPLQTFEISSGPTRVSDSEWVFMNDTDKMVQVRFDPVSAPDELRPPPEHADKPLHWVQQNKNEPTVLHWQPSSDLWTTFDGHRIGPAVSRIGYRYLGPAEYVDDQRVATLRAQITDGFAAQSANAQRLGELAASCAAASGIIDGLRKRLAQEEAGYAKLEERFAATHQVLIETHERMAAEDRDAPAPADTSTDAVAKRVSDVIGDLTNGRVTKDQRKSLGRATEQADRVPDGAHAGVGRAIGR